jgi:hypothetical protein
MSEDVDRGFTYDIKNEEIAQALVEQGFTIFSVSTDGWTMEAPETVSATKARKIISTVIKLYIAAKEVNRSNQRYEYLLEKLERLHLSN